MITVGILKVNVVNAVYNFADHIAILSEYADLRIAVVVENVVISCIVVVTVGAGISYLAVYNCGSERCVSSGSMICKSAFATYGRTCAFEGVSHSVATPATCTSGLLATGSLGELVSLSVKSVVTVSGVTEVHVIKHNTGLSCIGPTGELECLNLLRIKVSAVSCRCAKISGISACKCTVDVVISSHSAINVKVDNDHNVEPLGPTVFCCRNGSKLKSAVNTALNLDTCFIVSTNCKNSHEVIGPRATVIPVRSVSGLTDTKTEIALSSFTACHAGLYVEGDNANCVACAREVGKSVLISLTIGEPRLHLAA